MSIRIAAISSSASVAAVEAAGLHVDRHRQVAAEAPRHERRGARRRHRRRTRRGFAAAHADGTTRQAMRPPARSGTSSSCRKGSGLGTRHGSRLRVRVSLVARQAVEVGAVEGGERLELARAPRRPRTPRRTARCRRARRRCRRSRRRPPWRGAHAGRCRCRGNSRGLPPATASSRAARCGSALSTGRQ